MTDKDTDPQATAQSGDPKNKPVMKYDLAGGTQLALWRNRSRDGRMFHAFTISRRYQDGNGDWKDSNSWPVQHIDTIVLALQSIKQEAARLHIPADEDVPVSDVADDTPF